MTPPVARGHVEAACAWMIAFARMVEGVGSPEFQVYRQHDCPRIDSPASESLAPVRCGHSICRKRPARRAKIHAAGVRKAIQ